MKIKLITIHVCEACLDGQGEVCHTPGCALFLHKVDLPIHPEMYTVLEEYDEADQFPAETAEEQHPCPTCGDKGKVDVAQGEVSRIVGQLPVPCPCGKEAPDEQGI